MTLRFNRRPFRPSFAPDAYVATPVHEAALARLRFAAEETIVLLDGEPGTGKTLLALKRLSECAATCTPIYLPGGRFDRPESLYQAILVDLNLPSEGKNDVQSRFAVHNAFLKMAADNKPAMLALDDAHDLGDPVLDELRCLSNLTAFGINASKLLLVGSTALRERLKPDLAARIAWRIRLEPLDRKAAEQYVRDQWLAAGGNLESLNREAVTMIAAAGGNPRSINRLAALALAVATDAGETAVDAEAVLEASARLNQSEEPVRLPLPAKSKGGTAPAGGIVRDAMAGRTPKGKARKRPAA